MVTIIIIIIIIIVILITLKMEGGTRGSPCCLRSSPGGRRGEKEAPACGRGLPSPRLRPPPTPGREKTGSRLGVRHWSALKGSVRHSKLAPYEARARIVYRPGALPLNPLGSRVLPLWLAAEVPPFTGMARYCFFRSHFGPRAQMA